MSYVANLLMRLRYTIVRAKEVLQVVMCDEQYCSAMARFASLGQRK